MSCEEARYTASTRLSHVDRGPTSLGRHVLSAVPSRLPSIHRRDKIVSPRAARAWTCLGARCTPRCLCVCGCCCVVFVSLTSTCASTHRVELESMSKLTGDRVTVKCKR